LIKLLNETSSNRQKKGKYYVDIHFKGFSIRAGQVRTFSSTSTSMSTRPSSTSMSTSSGPSSTSTEPSSTSKYEYHKNRTRVRVLRVRVLGVSRNEIQICQTSS